MAPQRTVMIHIETDDKQEFIRIANDVWARLQDASALAAISVTYDARDVHPTELDEDYDSRYRNASKWPRS